MSNIWLSLIAFASVLIVGIVYGGYTFVFSGTFLLCFFIAYGSFVFDAMDQEGANPDLGQLQNQVFGDMQLSSQFLEE